MNIRMPRRMYARVTEVQDEYLKERIRENGIVTLSDCILSIGNPP
jgi:hypothetical protein